MKHILLLLLITGLSTQVFAQAGFVFAADSAGCDYSSITFTPDSLNGTHAWDFGDGNFSGQTSPTHVYADTGTYSVTHTFDNGVITVDSMQVHVGGDLTIFFDKSQSWIPGCTSDDVWFWVFGTYGGSGLYGYWAVQDPGIDPVVGYYGNGYSYYLIYPQSLTIDSAYLYVNDTKGCIDSVLIDVTTFGLKDFQLSGLTVTDADCTGQGGSIEIDSLIDGTLPYDITWFNSQGVMPDTTISLTNIPTGAYRLRVIDSVGCFISHYDTVDYLRTMTVTDSIVIDTSCAKDQNAIYITVNGGVSPYTYLWSTGAISQNLTNILPSFYEYKLTITDAIGCVSFQSYNIPPPLPLNMSLSVGKAYCGLLDDGSIRANPSSGYPPYSYMWNTGDTTREIDSLAPGQYAVTVTDSAGCTTTRLGVVTDYIFGINSIVGPTTCNFNNGIIQIYPTSPYPPYQIQWSNGMTDDTITGLAQGTYSVTVSDSLGCVNDQESFVVGLNDTCKGSISGTVFNDLNQNCIQDINEFGIPGVWVAINPGNGMNTDINGDYTFVVDPGTYTVSHNDNNFGPLCPAGGQYTRTITQAATSVGNDFADTAKVDSDLRSETFCGFARPGFSHTIDFFAINDGSYTTGGYIKARLDSIVFNGAGFNPPPDSMDPLTHCVVWNFQNLAPNQQLKFRVIKTLSPGTTLGLFLSNSATVYPVVGDATPANNSSGCTIAVTGSYDPNDKQVSINGVDGDGAVNIAHAQAPFEYTIRFQNTGTDTAFNIVVRDTLQSSLSPATFKLLATSHECVVNFPDSNILEFTFNNILLPDSFVNEPESHGFIRFSVERSNTPGEVQNQAAIYFDFNAPIYTNTTATTFTTGIAEIFKPKLSVYPNPTREVVLIQTDVGVLGKVQLFDLAGHMVKELDFVHTASTSISLIDLASGTYIVRVTSGDSVITGKVAVIK